MVDENPVSGDDVNSVVSEPPPSKLIAERPHVCGIRCNSESSLRSVGKIISGKILELHMAETIVIFGILEGLRVCAIC